MGIWENALFNWLDGRESEWTTRVGDGQGGLACCDSWGRKESDTAERLNWTELNPKSEIKSSDILCGGWKDLEGWAGEVCMWWRWSEGGLSLF